jgi:hypothetical protein
MPGAGAPAAARGVVVNTRVSHHGHTGNTRHSPRNGLRLTSCSPRRPGLFATVTPEKLASQELDASVGASGPHDFAVRRSIIRPCAFAHMMPLRPSHPAPNVRDDREAPLLWERDGHGYRLICDFGKSEYFCRKDWTDDSTRGALICPSGKLTWGHSLSSIPTPLRLSWHLAQCRLLEATRTLLAARHD